MSDLTLLLVTANKIDENSAKKMREYLLEVTENKYPIISVSQKPIDFGKNICVGEIGTSKYNEYKQLLIGAKEVKTEYVACIDDDALYSPEHFTFRPPKGVFAYEINYWFCQIRKDFYWRVGDKRKRGGMWGCIVDSETLVNNLTRRFEYYPNDPWIGNINFGKQVLWGEPGIRDDQFGMENKMMRFESSNPCVIFVHELAMGYKQLLGFRRRYGNPPPEDVKYELEQFGSATDLWNKYWENGN